MKTVTFSFPDGRPSGGTGSAVTSAPGPGSDPGWFYGSSPASVPRGGPQGNVVAFPSTVAALPWRRRLNAVLGKIRDACARLEAQAAGDRLAVATLRAAATHAACAQNPEHDPAFWLAGWTAADHLSAMHERLAEADRRLALLEKSRALAPA